MPDTAIFALNSATILDAAVFETLRKERTDAKWMAHPDMQKLRMLSASMADYIKPNPDCRSGLEPSLLHLTRCNEIAHWLYNLRDITDIAPIPRAFAGYSYYLVHMAHLSGMHHNIEDRIKECCPADMDQKLLTDILNEVVLLPGESNSHRLGAQLASPEIVRSEFYSSIVYAENLSILIRNHWDMISGFLKLTTHEEINNYKFDLEQKRTGVDFLDIDSRYKYEMRVQCLRLEEYIDKNFSGRAQTIASLVPRLSGKDFA